MAKTKDVRAAVEKELSFDPVGSAEGQSLGAAVSVGARALA